jgi:peptidoglycan/xylan/chitin deacetylase (PgdA/CDA1 family)
MELLCRVQSRARATLARATRVKRIRSRLQAPVASFTFDDFPRSALADGAPLLARYGGKATYYAAGQFCGQHADGIDYYDLGDLRAAHTDGHEVACHSFDHVRGSRFPSPVLEDDLDRNAAFLREALGEAHPVENFAYPFGHVSPRTKRLAGRRFASSRGIQPGVNAGVLELAELKAVPLERRSWTAAQVERLVAQARAQRGWIIFFSHDVSEDPSPFGATPAMLDHALRTVRGAGLEILTVRGALAKAA